MMEKQPVKYMKRGGVKEVAEEDIDDGLHAYVLISCKRPSEEGNMGVEMSFDGDPDLVRLMLSTALQRLDSMSDVEH